MFMPLWRFLDKMTWMFRGSTLPKTAAILGILGAAILALFIVPIDFDLEGNGALKPSRERQVYAHVDGEVSEVFVRHSQHVEAGERLFQLKNPELEQQISSVEGEKKTALTRLANAKDAQNRFGSMTQAERIKNQQEIEESLTTVDAKNELLKLYKEKTQKLLKKSEIAGIVSTWDVEKVLNARPVVTGQLLMTIYNPDADWEIEVKMPEKRMRYLDQAMQGAKDKGYLDVDFVLKSKSDVTHKGRLYANGVCQRAELDAEDGAIVKLRCIPDSEAMKQIPRFTETQVVADVKCGKRSAAFVWFHEVVEWVRINVWF